MYAQHISSDQYSFENNGLEVFYGIATDAANEPYKQGALYLENNTSLVYWQDNRLGEIKIYGTLVSELFEGGNVDYFENNLSAIPNKEELDDIWFIMDYKVNYEKIINIPNVTLIHPEANSQELISKSQAVISITGSTGFEALFYKKPVIIFVDEFKIISL